jgi:predicted unusual protein kinase regulating ubiquinone biosynthesis (AarF/ABC1/UbiB family)
VSDEIPRRSVQRSARLATLPLGFASRTAAGWGRRLAGGDRSEITADVARRGAEQLFAVLGELKGGAMKFGQALSVFEAAVPPELAEPYREALTRLQTAAPPMPAARTHRVLAEQFGRGWRERFREFDDTPAAAASIGQVHRAVWHDGREVAVKVQYPGAEEAIMADLRQLQRFARVIQPMVPGMEIKPLLAELRDRMAEELDYRDEADAQRAFAAAYDGDDEVVVPRVVASAPKAMISEWISGTPLSQVIRVGEPEERDRVGTMLSRFHFSAPSRVGLLHADPHPGNFQILADGRLCVIDFGAVARLPDGLPYELGHMLDLAVNDKSEELLTLMRDLNFVLPDTDMSADRAMTYLGPLVDPLRTETFHFTREWIRGQADRLGDLRRPEFETGRGLNLPPQYMLIHRVTLASVAVLCQLDAEVPLKQIFRDFQPGFDD